jgi:hypothetical protein
VPITDTLRARGQHGAYRGLTFEALTGRTVPVTAGASQLICHRITIRPLNDGALGSALRPPNATPLLVQLEGTLRAKKCAEQCVSFARDQTIRGDTQRDASDCKS